MPVLIEGTAVVVPAVALAAAGSPAASALVGGEVASDGELVAASFSGSGAARDALARLDAGTYGWDDEALCWIREERLQALPWARREIEGQRRFEDKMKHSKRDSYQVEKRYIRKDGRVIWGRLTISLMRPLTGGEPPTHFVALVEDITESKRLKDELQDYARRLEERVSDRTRKLSVLYQVTSATSDVYDLATMLGSSLEALLPEVERRTAGLRSFKNMATPAYVPPVPVAATQASTRPWHCSQISGPVVA